MNNKPHHFLCISGLNWSTHNDLFKCLKIQKRMDKERKHYTIKECDVWKVPGKNEDSNYTIDNHKPDVKGAKYITTITY
jgi:hypothetical protein